MSTVGRSARIGWAILLLTFFVSGCSQDLPTRSVILKVSPAAADHLRSMRDKGNLKHDAVVRISVQEGNFFRMKNGGEKRYRYSIVIDDAPKELNKYFEMESQGLTIQVPKSSADFLRGSEIIWLESGGKGGFKFQNPNQLPEDGKEQIISSGDSDMSPRPEEKSSSSTGQTPTPRQDSESSGSQDR